VGLTVDSLDVCYPGRVAPALRAVTLDVPEARTLAVVGPSGAGKSTLLRVIAGLLPAAGGDIRLNGQSVLTFPPQERRIALVFQDDALFTNMTVRENLRFALRGRRAESDALVTATAHALHVDKHLDRRPRQLSGGERQRASIARALLSDPLALLLDEPLAHLDPSLRRSVRDEVVGVRQRFPGPILYVTHDHVEAMSVGDALAVLVEGRIEDSGDPQRVYDAPRTVGVARFLGERPMNLFDGDGATVGIRPECIRLGAQGTLAGRIVRREPTGADAYLDVETERGTLAVRVSASSGVRVGELVALDLPPESIRRFDRTTGVALA
jgi:multiple sugar transport system ATP-binding protein